MSLCPCTVLYEGIVVVVIVYGVVHSYLMITWNEGGRNETREKEIKFIKFLIYFSAYPHQINRIRKRMKEGEEGRGRESCKVIIQGIHMR